MPQNLPTSIREKLERESLSSGGGAWRLLTFMIFVFAVFLVSYFGLTLGYRSFVSSQIEVKDKEIAALAEKVPKQAQEEFLKFQFQVINLKKLLERHIFSSKIFPLVEANTNSRVFYSSFDLNVKENKLTLSATAQSYETLAEQLSALERLPEVLDYKVSGAKTGEGGQVQFDVSLTLSPKVFR